MPRCRDINDLCCVGKLVQHLWMGSWEIQRWVIYDHDIDTICSPAFLQDKEVEVWWGARTLEGRKGKRDRRYGCWERFKDSSHASCQVLDWGIQSMTSLLCWVEQLSNLTTSAPPLLWFCLGRIKKAQMEHRTWRWAGSPKMSRSRPSACGRLVRSTLVRAEHLPIHPAKKAYPSLCNECVTSEKPFSLTPAPSLDWAAMLLYWGRCWSQNKDHSQLAMEVEPLL